MARNVGLKTPYDPVWERVKQITGWNKDNQLAAFLKVQPGTISGARQRDSFPLQWAFKVSQEYQCNTDWLMTGEDPMYRKDAGRREMTDSDLEFISEAWPGLPIDKRKELCDIIKDATFPYTEELAEFGEHSPERAWKIQELAYDEYGYQGLNFETTKGREEYLAGGLSDEEFLGVCRAEIKRMHDIITKAERKGG